jgi:hypothetical protein
MDENYTLHDNNLVRVCVSRCPLLPALRYLSIACQEYITQTATCERQMKGVRRAQTRFGANTRCTEKE